jgi:hypothetical protein
MNVDQCSSNKVASVAAYLKREATRSDGALYIKSKFIADDLALSAKEIGSSIKQLSERDGDLVIEKWAYTGSTTWRVTVENE